MNLGNDLLIEPQVIQRVRGGILAITPKSAPICIGVIADTEEEAREKFSQCVTRWKESRLEELAKQSLN